MCFYSNNLRVEIFPQVLVLKHGTNTACSLYRPLPSRTAVNSCEYLKVSWGEIAAEIFVLTITVSSSYKGSPQVTLPMQPKWLSHTIKALRVFHIWSAKWSLTTGSLAV